MPGAGAGTYPAQRIEVYIVNPKQSPLPAIIGGVVDLLKFFIPL